MDWQEWHKEFPSLADRFRECDEARLAMVRAASESAALCDEQEAVIARFRAALEEIAKSGKNSGFYCAAVARQALKGRA